MHEWVATPYCPSFYKCPVNKNYQLNLSAVRIILKRHGFIALTSSFSHVMYFINVQHRVSFL